METLSHYTNQSTYNKKLIFALIFAGIVVILAIIIIPILNQNPDSSTSIPETDSWNNLIIESEELNIVLGEDYNAYARNAIFDALDEYFLSLYPSGTGLNYVRHDNESIRLIDSYGSFHTLAVSLGTNATIIKIDDNFEKSYQITLPNREEQER